MSKNKIENPDNQVIIKLQNEIKKVDPLIYDQYKLYVIACVLSNNLDDPSPKEEAFFNTIMSDLERLIINGGGGFLLEKKPDNIILSIEGRSTEKIYQKLMYSLENCTYIEDLIPIYTKELWWEDNQAVNQYLYKNPISFLKDLLKRIRPFNLKLENVWNG